MREATHRSWTEILDHIEAGRPQGSVAEHMSGCPACARLGEEARMILAAMRVSSLPGPSEELIQETWKKMAAERREVGRGEGLVERIREVWAVLVTPPLVASPALRGVAVPRVLIYETGEFAVSLSVSEAETGSGRDVIGKVIPRKASSIPPGGQAVLRRADSEEETDLAEFGGFRFSNIPPGEIRIHVEIAGSRILLPPLPEVAADG